jgi:hypothetical protein
VGDLSNPAGRFPSTAVSIQLLKSFPLLLNNNIILSLPDVHLEI